VSFENGVVLWRNNGASGFAAAATIAPFAVDAVFGDVDGALDLVLATPSGAEVHGNDGAGNFALVPFAMPAIYFQSDSIAAADLEGDGDLDVVTGGQTTHVYLNDGSDFFAENSVRWLRFVGGSVGHVHFADVNADGAPDLIGTTGYTSDSVVFLTNAGGRLQPERSLGSATRGGIPGSIDADGDGSSEIVVATADDVSHRLYEISSSRILDLTADDAAPEAGPLPLDATAVADFDGNGLLDLVGALGGPGYPFVLWPQDAGGFPASPVEIPVVNGPSATRTSST